MTTHRLASYAVASGRRAAVPPRRTLALAIHTALLSFGAVAASALLTPAHAQQAGTTTTTTTTNSLGEILVTAERDREAKRAGTTTIIGGAELNQRNSQDMSNLGRYEPLISVPMAASGGGSIWDGSGNTGVNIRGLEGNRVSLDIDGIAMPDATPKVDGNNMNSYGIGRDYFDPETFREVRISSGTSASGPGVPGLGGSVAFGTKAPEDYLGNGVNTYAEYKFGYTSANTSRMHALTGAQRVGAVNLLAVAIHRDGEQTENNGSVAANQQNWQSDALLAKANWTLSPEQQLNFTLDLYKRSGDSRLANKVATYYPSGASQDNSTRRNRFSLEHRYTPAGASLFDSLTTRAYVQDAKVEDQTDGLYTFGSPGQRHIVKGNNTKTSGIFSDALKQLDASNLLAYGVRYDHSENTQPWYEDRTIVATGVHQITRKNRMADTDTDQFSAYLRDEYSFSMAGHKAVLTPGVRGEWRQDDPKNLQNYVVAVPAAAREIRKSTQHALTPSLSLSVELTPELVSYFEYKRGARLPTAAERTSTYDSFSYTGAGTGYAVLGNPDLKKETSNAFEVGLKGAPAQGLQFSSALFYTRYNNYIDYATQPLDPVNYPTIVQGLFRPENIGKVKSWGAEVSARYELGAWAPSLRGLSGALAGGVAHSEVENTITGRSSELASTLPFKGSAGLAYDDAAQRFGLALNGVYTKGKQAETTGVATTVAPLFNVPSATVFDFTAYWNIGQHAKLNVGAYNLADKQYWDYSSSRSLDGGSVASTRTASLAEIQRQARPGRNYSISVSLNY